MRRIGRGDRVFVVLSDKYLRSPYCMFELFEVWRRSRAEDEEFLWRIRVYSLPDAQIRTTLDQTNYAVFWKEEQKRLETLTNEHGPDVMGEWGFKQFKPMGDFYRHVSDILATMTDIVQPNGLDELKRYAFDDLPPGAAPGAG